MEENAFSELIGDLYSSALKPESGERVANGLSRLLGGGTSIIWTVDPRTAAVAGPVLTTFPAEAMEAYAAHYYRSDPWMGRFPLMQQGVPVRGSSLIEDTALERTAYYNEFGRRYETFHVVGAVLPLAVGQGAPFAACAVLRPQRSGGFEDAEAANLARILPHIRRAAQLARTLSGMLEGQAGGALRAALDVIGTPALVLDRAGRAVIANSAAEALDAAGAGLALCRRTSEGTFGFDDDVSNRALRLALTDVTRGGAGGIVRPRLGNGEPWLGIVTPLPSGLAALSSGSAAAALLVLRSLGRSGEALLRRRAEAFLGLTPAEAETAASLAGGLSPTEIAEARGVRITTIRSLIRRALERAEARNIRDLVRIMGALNA